MLRNRSWKGRSLIISQSSQGAQLKANILTGLVETTHLPPLTCENLSLPNTSVSMASIPHIFFFEKCKLPQIVSTRTWEFHLLWYPLHPLCSLLPYKILFPNGRKLLKKGFLAMCQGAPRTLEEERKCTWDPFIEAAIPRRHVSRCTHDKHQETRNIKYMGMFQSKMLKPSSFWNAGNGCSLQAGNPFLSGEPGTAYRLAQNLSQTLPPPKHSS